MKLLISSLFFLFFVGSLQGQTGIEFFNGSFADALEKAKAEEKLIFVDAYAKWCGPCKKMAANVFTDPAVGEFMNANYISLKIDMEEVAGAEFGGLYPVSAYPTLFFINPTDKAVIKKQVGGLSSPQLIDIAKNVRGAIDNSKPFAERWDKGEHSAEVALGYIKALNQAGKPSLKIANAFFTPQMKPKTDEELSVLFEALTEADSRIYDLFIANRPALEKLKTKPVCDLRLEKACRMTARKAGEFKSNELWQEALVKMRSDLPTQADAFEAEQGLSFYEIMAEKDKFVKAAKSYARIYKSDAPKLLALAQRIAAKYGSDKDILKEACKNCETAADLDPDNAQYWFSLAQMQAKAGDKSKGLKTAEKAKTAAQVYAPELLPQIKQWIDQNSI